MLEMMLSLT